MWHALATYTDGETDKPALVLERGLFDLDAACAAAQSSIRAHCADGVGALVARWATVEEEIGRLAVATEAQAAAGRLRAIAPAPALRAPYRPSRIFAAASNYRAHAKEMGTVLAPRTESAPYFFIKPDSSVTDPGAPVEIPRGCQKPDWEVELAVVLGRGGRHVSVDTALDLVAGYTILNDVTARDLTRRSDYPFGFDWMRGKGYDTFAPLGPWFVPRASVGDPQRLSLRLDVNGERMQDDTTASMIFTIAEQIAYLSTIITLKPGDLVATGTPDGVGMGRGVFLKAGDVMRASIEGLGTLENPVREA